MGNLDVPRPQWLAEATYRVCIPSWNRCSDSIHAPPGAAAGRGGSTCGGRFRFLYAPTTWPGCMPFPTSVTGKGNAFALIELGGGFTPSDTTSAFKSMGLTPPTVIAVSVDGGKNTPSPDDGADGEVALDIQVAGGAAPGAKIAVYFAPITDAGFVDAIPSAVHDTANKPSVVSISWGSAESNWTQQATQSMNTALQERIDCQRVSGRGLRRQLVH